MASEIIQNSGSEEPLREVDRIIDELQEAVGVLDTTQGPVPRDANLSKILRALRILRQQVASAHEKMDSRED